MFLSLLALVDTMVYPQGGVKLFSVVSRGGVMGGNLQHLFLIPSFTSIQDTSVLKVICRQIVSLPNASPGTFLGLETRLSLNSYFPIQAWRPRLVFFSFMRDAKKPMSCNPSTLVSLFRIFSASPDVSKAGLYSLHRRRCWGVRSFLRHHSPIHMTWNGLKRRVFLQICTGVLSELG